MPTNDNEFFRSAVTDEWNTPRPLTDPEQEETAAQKQFSRKRKQTARKAFGLAAPVAVVAVAAVISSAVQFCAVCGRETCSYFSTTPQEVTQYLWQEDLPAARPETSTDANRFTYTDCAFDGTVSQQEVCPLDAGDVYVTHDFSALPETLGLGSDYFCHAINYHIKTAEDDSDYVYYMVYSQQGSALNYEGFFSVFFSPTEPSTSNLNFISIYEDLGALIEQQADAGVTAPLDVPNVWLMAYSFSPRFTARQLMDALLQTEYAVTPKSQTIHIGSSLKLLPSGNMSLNRATPNSLAAEAPWSYFVHDVNGSRRFALHTGATYDFSCYFADDFSTNLQVEFAPADWNTVANEWNRLFRQAPEFGHHSLAADVPLQQVTVNGVVYTPYMQIRLNPDTGNYMRRQVYFVPDCQPTCRLVLDSLSSSTEELPADQLFAMSSQPSEQVIAEILGNSWQDALASLYPADAEATPAVPTASPAPTATPRPTAPVPSGSTASEGTAESAPPTAGRPGNDIDNGGGSLSGTDLDLITWQAVDSLEQASELVGYTAPLVELEGYTPQAFRVNEEHRLVEITYRGQTEEDFFLTRVSPDTFQNLYSWNGEDYSYLEDDNGLLLYRGTADTFHAVYWMLGPCPGSVIFPNGTTKDVLQPLGESLLDWSMDFTEF